MFWHVLTCNLVCNLWHTSLFSWSRYFFVRICPSEAGIKIWCFCPLRNEYFAKPLRLYGPQNWEGGGGGGGGLGTSI